MAHRNGADDGDARAGLHARDIVYGGNFVQLHVIGLGSAGDGE